MSEEFADSKTEAPTPRRRESAREDGQVVFSPDLTAGVLMFGVAISIWLYGANWFGQFSRTIADQVINIAPTEWGMSQTMLSVRWLGAQIMIISGVLVAGSWILNVFISTAQAGIGFNSKPLMLNPDKLSLIQGWGRIWSLDGLMKGFLAIVKLAAVIGVSGVFIWVVLDSILLETRGTLQHCVSYIASVATTLMLILAGVSLSFGVIDYAFRWYRHEEKLKMSREDVKREQKEEQGDQQIKQQMRRFAQNARKRRSLQDVPTASAVITNPTHFAVAIRYKAGSSAPVVVAKGADHFARQIIAMAEKHGVPVMQRKPVARALFAMTEIGQEIPLELYRAVAEVLAEVYRKKRAA
jgi:flagellar biosynthetic protein FlhB